MDELKELMEFIVAHRDNTKDPKPQDICDKALEEFKPKLSHIEGIEYGIQPLEECILVYMIDTINSLRVQSTIDI